MFAYADDGLVLVMARSRKELQDRANGACNAVLQWSKDVRLTLSVAKTKIVFLKGKRRLRGILPTIKMGDERLEFVQQVKYLGVILDDCRYFTAHIDYAARKAISTFYKIRRLVQANWGIQYRELKMIYSAVGEAILLYGAAAWAHRMKYKTYAAKLNRAQRAMLITVCRSYRTVATDALPVLAAIMPADLTAQMRKELYWDKRNDTNTKTAIKDKYMTIWQERWTNSDKGRPLHEIWPNIQNRLELAIAIGHYDSQYLTGHGNFMAYLQRFGLRNTDLCEICNLPDTPQHVIYECLKYIEKRADLVWQLEDIGLAVDVKEAADTKAGFDVLSNWWTIIARIRESEDF